ncbi:MAG: histone deacetylase family protein [Acidimicrobiales bacterium]
MSVLLVTHEDCGAHDPGGGHPERADRLRAVEMGIARSGVGEALIRQPSRPATRAELERVHSPSHLDAVEGHCLGGGGYLDSDTGVCGASWSAAVVAAGAGPMAVERLDHGEAEAAFLAVRPPGHHATGAKSMGFCLLNNVAVCAAGLADRGERVAIVDYDAHHGNGTQDAFYGDARVLYVSLHQWPAYPGTGRLEEVGTGPGEGTTLNLPLPAGTTGEVYRAALDEVVVPSIEAFAPSWMILSAGFDAHRADPLTSMGLSAADFADLTASLVALVPPGRRLAFLEGGYDLQALADSAGACVAALAGVRWHPEPPSAGGPPAPVVDLAARRLAATA